MAIVLNIQRQPGATGIYKFAGQEVTPENRALAPCWHRPLLHKRNPLNQSLEKANRISDFLELAELMCTDALHRPESCGGHGWLKEANPPQ